MTQTTTDPRDKEGPDLEPATPAAAEPPMTPEPAAEPDAPIRQPAVVPSGPVRAADRPQATPNARETRRTPLFDVTASDDLRARWTDVQTKFVDEPRSAVQEADALVGDVMERLTDTFTRERRGLEGQWSRGEDVTTEDLRLALQRYRSFFDRLLSL
jgi:hypothetical protein